MYQIYKMMLYQRLRKFILLYIFIMHYYIFDVKNNYNTIKFLNYIKFIRDYFSSIQNLLDIYMYIFMYYLSFEKSII